MTNYSYNINDTLFDSIDIEELIKTVHSNNDVDAYSEDDLPSIIEEELESIIRINTEGARSMLKDAMGFIIDELKG